MGWDETRQDGIGFEWNEMEKERKEEEKKKERKEGGKEGRREGRKKGKKGLTNKEIKGRKEGAT